VLAKLV